MSALKTYIERLYEWLTHLTAVCWCVTQSFLSKRVLQHLYHGPILSHTRPLFAVHCGAVHCCRMSSGQLPTVNTGLECERLTTTCQLSYSQWPTSTTTDSGRLRCAYNIHSCTITYAEFQKLFRSSVTVVSRGLTSHSTLYRSFRDDFYRPDDPINSIKALKEVSWPLR